MESAKKKVMLEPNNNSIAYTCKKVLEKDFDIVNQDPDLILICSDTVLTYDKGDTEYYFNDKVYYPTPIKNTICIKKPIDGSGSKGIVFDIYKHNEDEFIYQKLSGY